MAEDARRGEPFDAADAELADAVDSIEAIGEDWRSSERGTDNESPAEGQDNG